MSLAVPEDAAAVLEQYVHDVANTPAEINHLLEEIQAKDLQIAAFKDEINKRDNQLQKWVRVNGGHVQNPKEDAFSRTISDCYDKCEILQAEKCGLSDKMTIVLERQIRRLDVGLRGLAAREEFPADWNGPSLLSASGNVTGVHTPATGGGGAVQTPLQAVSGNIGSTGGMPNIANAAQIRMAQQAAATGRSGTGGTQTPSSMPRSQREGSSEANKRRRLNVSLGTLPAASSNLRQSSLGPGTPKAGTPAPVAGGTSRAGSAQPARPTAGQKKGSTIAAPSRRPAPGLSTSTTRKRDRNRASKKGDRRRALKSDRATPSTNASVSDSEDAGSDNATPSSLPRSQADGAGDRRGGRDRENHHNTVSDDEDDGEEDEDNSLYCICNHKSYGDMIACDNDNCARSWFHYGCVGIKQQPVGEWLCPECTKLPRKSIVKSE